MFTDPEDHVKLLSQASVQSSPGYSIGNGLSVGSDNVLRTNNGRGLVFHGSTSPQQLAVDFSNTSAVIRDNTVANPSSPTAYKVPTPGAIHDYISSLNYITLSELGFKPEDIS